MAERRMFAKSIVLSDAFLDMPLSARCLYFTLGMLADDDGFVGSPKSIMRQCGASQDDMAILLQKRYLLGFESGVIVIKHWRMNNYLQKDRYKRTTYLEELEQLADRVIGQREDQEGDQQLRDREGDAPRLRGQPEVRRTDHMLAEPVIQVSQRPRQQVGKDHHRADDDQKVSEGAQHIPGLKAVLDFFVAQHGPILPRGARLGKRERVEMAKSAVSARKPEAAADRLRLSEQFIRRA